MKEPGIYINDKLVKTWEQATYEAYKSTNKSIIASGQTIVVSPDEDFYITEPETGFCLDCQEAYIPKLLEVPEYAFSHSTFFKVPLYDNNIVPRSCFHNCQNLEEFDFSKVSIIEQQAFSGCNFKSLDLSRVKSIGIGAFNNNENLTDIILEDIEFLGNFTDNPDLNIFYKHTRDYLNRFVGINTNIYNRIICLDDTIEKIIEKHSLSKSNQLYRQQQELLVVMR